MNIQRVARHGFEMYLAKYIPKPESSFNVELSENCSAPERYLRTRVIGACEAIDVQLGFHQFHLSRSTMFLITELKPQRQFLKHRAQLASLPQDSDDIYVLSKYQVYLQRNSALYNITYPMYFQWWRKANYSEQCKGEKAADKGLTTSIGYKGTDEFEVLKASITDLNDKLAMARLWNHPQLDHSISTPTIGSLNIDSPTVGLLNIDSPTVESLNMESSIVESLMGSSTDGSSVQSSTAG